MPYYNGIEALFGHPVPYVGSYTSHFMVYRSPIVRAMFPDEMRLVPHEQLNVLYVAPSDGVLRRLVPYYDYASFHAYRRLDRLALKVAGGAGWPCGCFAIASVGVAAPDPG